MITKYICYTRKFNDMMFRLTILLEQSQSVKQVWIQPSQSVLANLQLSPWLICDIFLGREGPTCRSMCFLLWWWKLHQPQEGSTRWDTVADTVLTSAIAQSQCRMARLMIAGATIYSEIPVKFGRRSKHKINHEPRIASHVPSPACHRRHWCPQKKCSS